MIEIPKQKSLLNIDDPYTRKNMRKSEMIHFNNFRRHKYQFLYRIADAPQFYVVDTKLLGFQDQILTDAQIEKIREDRPL